MPNLIPPSNGCMRESHRTWTDTVASGPKSILNIGRTLEYLVRMPVTSFVTWFISSQPETQGVPVISYSKTKDFPSFFTPKSGLKVYEHLHSCYFSLRSGPDNSYIHCTTYSSLGPDRYCRSWCCVWNDQWLSLWRVDSYSIWGPDAGVDSSCAVRAIKEFEENWSTASWKWCDSLALEQVLRADWPSILSPILSRTVYTLLLALYTPYFYIVYIVYRLFVWGVIS